MKGYLLKEELISAGGHYFFESHAADSNDLVFFEDDGDTGYFYAAEIIMNSEELRILDMLFIYAVQGIPLAERKQKLSIIWSTDWQRAALVLGDICHAVFDFQNKAGYSISGFPPPQIWTGKERKLSKDMVNRFFK